MTDAQMQSLFSNISTHATHIVASTSTLTDAVVSAQYVLAGVLCALILAVTWKG